LAIAQESASHLPLSMIVGTRPRPPGAITAFSVKRHGRVSSASPLCASANLMRQQ
jgi:hypothetical protein